MAKTYYSVAERVAREEEARIEEQERLRDHHEQLQSIERELAHASEFSKNLQRQLDDGNINSDQFDDANRQMKERFRDMDHERSILRKKIDEATPGTKSNPVTINSTQEDHDTMNGAKTDVITVKTEEVLTMTKDQLEGHVQEGIAEAIAKQNAPTITQMRNKLGEAYIEQSKISDRMTLLTSKRSTRRSGQQDESEILQCEKELQKNVEYITELERLIPTARPDIKQHGAKSPLMKLNNIPSSAQVSRQPSPEREVAAQEMPTTTSETPLTTPAISASNPETTSTPLNTQSVPTEQTSDTREKTNIQLDDEHAHAFNGPATTKQQVRMVLDLVRDKAPSSQRLSTNNPRAETQTRSSNNTGMNTQRPRCDQQTTSGTTPTPRARRLSSTTSEGIRTRQSISQYAKSVAPMTFTGKPAQDIERFLKQMDRYLRRAEIDNEEEMTEQLHRYLSEEIRTSLMNALTEDTEYDYVAQAEFLRCWWARATTHDH